MDMKRERDVTMRIIARKRLFKAVARECRIRTDAVRQWTRVPPIYALAVERAIGRPRHLIRPDIYPRETRRNDHGQASK